MHLRNNSYIAYETHRIMLKAKTPKPTESELEILTVLWDRGRASVRTVYEELSKTKDIGYTTALKLMQIMFEKKLVSRDSSSKVHIYAAAINREKTQKQLVNKMINDIFSGSTGQLVLQALGGHKASREELDKIEKLIAELKAKN